MGSNYLPDGVPPPHPTQDDFPFWDYCKQRELRIQQCAGCNTFRHPPRPVCGECGHFAWNWIRVSGSGTVFSYTVINHPVHPALKESLPYNVVVVLLDGAGDVRLVSNVIDAAPEELRIGLPVELVWQDLPDGMALARFRKSGAAG